jgi:hypothetical protein
VLGGHLWHYSKHQLKRRHSLLTAHFQYNSFFIRQAAKDDIYRIEDDLPIQDTRCRNVRRHYRFANTRTSTAFRSVRRHYPQHGSFPYWVLHISKSIFLYDDFYTLFSNTVQFRVTTFNTRSRWFDSTLQHFLHWIFFLHRHANCFIVTQIPSSSRKFLKQ